MFWHKKTYNSKLFTEKDFYNVFLSDLSNSKKEVIIESPFISSSRMKFLMPELKNLLAKRAKVHIITRSI